MLPAKVHRLFYEALRLRKALSLPQPYNFDENVHLNRTNNPMTYTVVKAADWPTKNG